MLKINILLIVIFLSIVIFASSKFLTGIVGTTQLNGEGCVCHSLTPSESVKVWVEGPGIIAQGETVQYTISLSGGSAVRGGFNLAARYNNLSSADSLVIEIDNELTHNSPHLFSSVSDTVSWTFNYTALVQGWDTIYSASNSTNGNDTPTGDEWNFGEKFPVFVSPPVPVELVSFIADSKNKKVLLSWVTASELNNMGFEVQRSNDEKNFYTIGFVKGNGTATSSKQYSFSDSPGNSGKYFYRLKQVDFNGRYEFSDIVFADFILDEFILSQNFPNPFNPETQFSYSASNEGNLNLSIYNIQGELVEILSDGYISPGYHSIKWNASAFPSGVYFYQMKFQSKDGKKISDVKKMVLAK